MTTDPTSDAARKARNVAEHRKRRKERGDRKVTVWMGADTFAGLEVLAGVHGSKDKAITALINGAAR